MPELPEVQTTVSGLKKAIIGKTIRDIWSDFHIKTTHGYRSNLKNENYYQEFKRKAIGAKIISVERKGKNILIGLNNKHTIVVHMKMTGHLMVGKYKRATKRKVRCTNSKKNKETHTRSTVSQQRGRDQDVWVATEDGPLQDSHNQFIHFVATLSGSTSSSSINATHLVLSDMRKFASVCIVQNDKLFMHEGLSSLGPDPLDLGRDQFIERIRGRSDTPIKKVLLDQSVLAGIGNIYSDEILWASAVHPLSRRAKIPKSVFSRIYSSMKKILNKSIKLGGDSMSDYRNAYGKKGGFQNFHKAYRKTGEKCPKPGCRGIIKRITVGGRSSHFCPLHQIRY